MENIIKRFWFLKNEKLLDQIGLTHFKCSIKVSLSETFKTYVDETLKKLNVSKPSKYVRSERKQRNFVRIGGSLSNRKIKLSVQAKNESIKAFKQEKINNLLEGKIDGKIKTWIEMLWLKKQIINDKNVDKFDKMDVELEFSPSFVSNIHKIANKWDNFIQLVNNIDNNIDVINNIGVFRDDDFKSIVSTIKKVINPDIIINIDNKKTSSKGAWIMPTDDNNIGIGDC